VALVWVPGTNELASPAVVVYPGPVHAVTAHAVKVTVTGATTVGSKVVMRVGPVLEKLCAG